MKYKKTIFGMSLVVVLIFSGVLFGLQQNELESRYNEAIAYAEKGDFETARTLMNRVGEYKDAKVRTSEYNNEAGYVLAKRYYEEGDYEQSKAIFEQLLSTDEDYKDCAYYLDSIEYRIASQEALAGEVSQAYNRLKKLPLSLFDVEEKLDKVSEAKLVIGTWYCREHQIDLVLRGYVSENNKIYINGEIQDRKGFLLGDTTNKLTGEDMVYESGKFVWDLFGDGVKYDVTYENGQINVSKQGGSSGPVVFARKLEEYSVVDGDMNASVDAVNIDGGIR